LVELNLTGAAVNAATSVTNRRVKGPFEAKLRSRGATGGMHFPLRYSLWRHGVLAKDTEYRFQAQAVVIQVTEFQRFQMFQSFSATENIWNNWNGWNHSNYSSIQQRS
jgi:hypothetical protein